MTYILNEDTPPVIRAIGVSHTACKDEFRQIFDLTAGVHFHFCNIYINDWSWDCGTACSLLSVDQCFGEGICRTP